MNPFLVSNEEALQAYENALKSYSKHAKEKIDNYKKESQQVNCKSCNGLGTYAVPNGCDDFDIEICPICDGTGLRTSL